MGIFLYKIGFQYGLWFFGVQTYSLRFRQDEGPTYSSKGRSISGAPATLINEILTGTIIL